MSTPGSKDLRCSLRSRIEQLVGAQTPVEGNLRPSSVGLAVCDLQPV